MRDAREIIQTKKTKEHAFREEMESLSRVAQRKGKSLERDVDNDDEDDSSDFDSPPTSEDEDDVGYLLACTNEKRKKRVVHGKGLVVGRLLEECPFFLGQEFENADEFRKTVTNYCLSIGRDVNYTKNNAKKLGARCAANKCPFYIWTSVKQGKGPLVVKTLVPQHNCGRLAKVRKIRASWIARTYHSKFKVNPYLKCQEIVDTIWSEWGVKASLWLALEARRQAQALILGEYKEQYEILHRYAQEMKKSNPRNTIKFKLNNGVFERLYVCFDALKRGFLVGCRPFFGIDGCFLKGPFGGQLLVAVGRDGNNQMFPIAWACVEVEDTESWACFCSCLPMI